VYNLEGDLLADRPDVKNGNEVLVHQCNCITTNAKGLAKAIFSKYPAADCYQARPKRGVNPSEPGIIQFVRGTPVVNLFGQINPGRPKPSGADTKAKRLEYFASGLRAALKLPAKRISLPWKIGCGLAGGVWSEYQRVIREVAAENPEKQIFIYKLPEDRLKSFDASVRRGGGRSGRNGRTRGRGQKRGRS